MKPKRGDIDSTIGMPLSSMSSWDFDRVIEQVDWLKARLEVLKAHNT